LVDTLHCRELSVWLAHGITLLQKQGTKDIQTGNAFNLENASPTPEIYRYPCQMMQLYKTEEMETFLEKDSEACLTPSVL
jgi:hypothetical protein